MPKRIQRKREKGWKMPGDAVYVGRPTIWGNPYTVAGARAAGYQGTDAELAAMCIAQYRDLLERMADGRSVHTPLMTSAAINMMLSSGWRALRGLDLACWCPPGQPCHADVLLDLANR